MQLNTLPLLGILAMSSLGFSKPVPVTEVAHINSAKPTGGYYESCRNCSFHHPKLNAKFYLPSPLYGCECRKNNGEWGNFTTVNLDKRVSNLNGTLIWSKSGNYRASCSPAQLSQKKQSLLVAGCKNTLGVKSSTTLDLNKYLANDNGTLVMDLITDEARPQKSAGGAYRHRKVIDRLFGVLPIPHPFWDRVKTSASNSVGEAVRHLKGVERVFAVLPIPNLLWSRPPILGNSSQST